MDQFKIQILLINPTSQQIFHLSTFFFEPRGFPSINR